MCLLPDPGGGNGSGSRVSSSMGSMWKLIQMVLIIVGVNRYGGGCIVGVEIPEIRVNGSLMPAALQEFWVVCGSYNE